MLLVLDFVLFLTLHTTFALRRGKNKLPRRPLDPYGMENQEQEAAPSGEEECFSVLMSADIQYPWLDRPIKGRDKKELSKYMIRQYFLGMSNLTKSNSGCKVKAVIINGDLTAMGREDELQTFKDIFDQAKGDLGVPILLGLGERDYTKNVDLCENSNCSARMLIYMATYLVMRAHAFKAMDLQVFSERSRPLAYSIGHSCSEPPLRIFYNGSFAYSFDVKDVHFVQLQNYPTYQRNWNSNIYSKNTTTRCRYKGKQTFDIKSSLDWLENDLRQASAENKFIILCYHDPSDLFPKDAASDRFKRIITENRVAGIFVGHFEKNHGLYPPSPERYGNVPVFASGSAVFGTFLNVIFYPRAQNMAVHGYVSMYDGEAGRVPINNDTVRFSLRT